MACIVCDDCSLERKQDSSYNFMNMGLSSDIGLKADLARRQYTANLPDYWLVAT